MLQHLVSFPPLAREFNGEIAAECLESTEPIDRQIAEIWRAATAGTASSSGALIEALADSEYAGVYRAALAQRIALADDFDAAREDLAGAFLAFARRRSETRRAQLLSRYETDPTDENLAAYQAADREYMQLRQHVAPPTGPELRG